MAPRVDLEEAELRRVGFSGSAHHQAGIEISPSEADHAVTAMVKSAMPTGSSSRCQARSFHVDGSEKSALRRLRKPPEGDL